MPFLGPPVKILLIYLRLSLNLCFSVKSPCLGSFLYLLLQPFLQITLFCCQNYSFNIPQVNLKSEAYLFSPRRSYVCHLLFIVNLDGKHPWRIHSLIWTVSLLLSQRNSQGQRSWEGVVVWAINTFTRNYHMWMMTVLATDVCLMSS